MNRHAIAAAILSFVLMQPAGEAFSQQARSIGGDDGSERTRNRAPLKIRITSPRDRQVIDDSVVIVSGTVEPAGAALQGVTILGVPAQINGSSFAGAARIVTPVASERATEGTARSRRDMAHRGDKITVIVRATDSSGRTAETKLHVLIGDVEANTVEFSAAPFAGPPPLAVVFRAGDGGGEPGVGYELDFDGDGVADETAATMEELAGRLGHVYPDAGVYVPRLTVKNSAGKTFARALVVNVVRTPDLTLTWQAMRTALSAGNVEQAAGYFSLTTRDSWRNAFGALANAGVLQAAALGMADLQMGEIRDESAEADIETTRNGTTYSHPVLFVRDVDGVWRIKSF